MELRSVTLKNFRGYRNIKIEFSNGLQMLVGKNDIGKSTVFEALDVFFNGKEANIKLSVDDFNVKARSEGETVFSIGCEFELTERDQIFIETVPINPRDEYLLNEFGHIEIIKQWCIDGMKDTTYINCSIPNCITDDLFTAKQTELKKKIKEYNLENKANQTVNSSMRKALYVYLTENGNSDKSMRMIPTKNALAEKDIYDNISKAFPDFYLFKADRKNSTSDDEIQNPMSIAVKRAFESEDISRKVKEIEDIIVGKLNDINNATIEKLQELNVDYGNQLKARISTNWASAIKNDILDGNEVPINKRGSGIRRLLLLSYLMVEAEKKSYDKGKKDIIYAIEEPETALHPYMQNKFINQLICLAQSNRCNFGEEMPSNANELNRYQVLITTHLPNYVSYANLDQIIYLHKNEGIPERYLIDVNNKKKFIDFIQDEMGKIPIIDYKFIIFVEGDNDINALKHLGKIPELKAIFDLTRQDVNIISLNGGNLQKCVEFDYFWDLPVKQYHIYDSDVSKYKDIIDKRCNKKDNPKIRGCVTSRKEMENYIPISLIEMRIGLDLSAYYDKWNNLDFSITNTLLSQKDTSNTQFVQIKKIPDYHKREKALKAFLNETVFSGVTKELLEKSEAYKEIEAWFKEMKDLYDYKE